MRRLSMALAVAALAVALAACGSTTSTSSGGGGGGESGEGELNGTIVVGAALALTGDAEPVDAPPLEGLKTGINKVNEEGGIDGQKVKLILADTESNPSNGRSAVQSLGEQGAQIIIVTCNYDLSASAAETAQAEGKLVISLCAASPKFGAQGIGNLAYTNGTLTYQEGYILANFADKKVGKKPFLICDQNVGYGNEVCEGFEERWEQLGNSSAGEETYDSSQNESISSIITKLKASDADYVLLASGPPGAFSALRQLRSQGVELPVVAPQAFDGLYWVKGVPKIGKLYVDAVANVVTGDPRQAINEVIEEFHEENPGKSADQGGFMYGYTIAEMLQASIEGTKSTEGNALSEYMQSNKLETVLGPVEFTPELHAPTNRTLVINEYRNGKPYVVAEQAAEVEVNLHLGG